jgi:hypothetical protein
MDLPPLTQGKGKERVSPLPSPWWTYSLPRC